MRLEDFYWHVGRVGRAATEMPRISSTEAMRRAEVEEAARAEWQRFWASGVSYTSAPVQVFGGAPP